MSDYRYEVRYLNPNSTDKQLFATRNTKTARVAIETAETLIRKGFIVTALHGHSVSTGFTHLIPSNGMSRFKREVYK